MCFGHQLYTKYHTWHSNEYEYYIISALKSFITQWAKGKELYIQPFIT